MGWRSGIWCWGCVRGEGWGWERGGGPSRAVYLAAGLRLIGGIDPLAQPAPGRCFRGRTSGRRRATGSASDRDATAGRTVGPPVWEASGARPGLSRSRGPPASGPRRWPVGEGRRRRACSPRAWGGGGLHGAKAWDRGGHRRRGQPCHFSWATREGRRPCRSDGAGSPLAAGRSGLFFQATGVKLRGGHYTATSPSQTTRCTPTSSSSSTTARRCTTTRSTTSASTSAAAPRSPRPTPKPPAGPSTRRPARPGAARPSTSCGPPLPAVASSRPAPASPRPSPPPCRPTKRRW